VPDRREFFKQTKMESLETPEGVHRGYQKRKRGKRETEKQPDIDNDIGFNRICVTGKY